jgi:butyrate kinase
MSFFILVINPGSTSTKLALFENEIKISDEIVRHDASELSKFDNVADQFDFRMKSIDKWIESVKFDFKNLSAVVSRAAPLRPLEGGSYEITDQMIDDLKTMKYSNHASNLGAIIARHLAEKYNIPSLISDPITVDNFTDVARVSGLPEIERKSRAHALNIKEVCRREASNMGKTLSEVNFVCLHMGGGISVAALKGGKIIDVNDGLLGMGPFSPDRAGALPIGALVKLCYSGEFTEKEMIDKLSKKSGLIAYLGEADLRKVEEMIDNGDKKAKLYFEAMAYQIAKEVGMASVALKGNFEAIVLTGGMAFSDRLVKSIKNYAGFLGKFIVVQGEFEVEALAAAGYRYLTNQESLIKY